jgi:hypothetical protein
MKKTFIVLSLFMSCATYASAQEAVLIKDEATFLKQIAGKKWVHSYGKTWLKVNPNGTLVGDSPKGKLAMTWEWRGNKWCRKGKFGQAELKEECQKFYMIGTRIMKNVNKNAPKGSYYYLK